MSAGWVLIRSSPTFWSPWNSDRIPVETPGGSSPSFSNDADRIRFSPTGRSSLAIDLLLEHPDEVVDVVQPVVLDVQRMTAEARALGEQHSARAGSRGCRPHAPTT